MPSTEGPGADQTLGAAGARWSPGGDQRGRRAPEGALWPAGPAHRRPLSGVEALPPPAPLLGLLLLVRLIPAGIPAGRFLQPHRPPAVPRGPDMPPRKRAGPTQDFRCSRIAAFPVNRPPACATLYFEWNAPAYVHMVRHRLPFDPLKAGWDTEFPQALPDVLAEGATDGLLPLCRSDNEVVSAIPPYVALTLPRAHRG